MRVRTNETEDWTIFESASEASQYLKVDCALIRRACKFGWKAKGHIVEYADPSEREAAVSTRNAAVRAHAAVRARQEKDARKAARAARQAAASTSSVHDLAVEIQPVLKQQFGKSGLPIANIKAAILVVRYNISIKDASSIFGIRRLTDALRTLPSKVQWVFDEYERAISDVMDTPPGPDDNAEYANQSDRDRQAAEADLVRWAYSQAGGASPSYEDVVNSLEELVGDPN